MRFRLALHQDDEAIRQLMQQIPLNGNLRIRYLKEPSFLNSLITQGNHPQTLIGTIDGKIMATGSRIFQNVIIQGDNKTVGYICNLRFHPDARNGFRLLKGIQHFENLPTPGPVDFHYATLIDSDPATKSILAANRPRMPHLFDLGKVSTFFIPLKKQNRSCRKSSVRNIVAADEEFMPEIRSFINHEGVKHNFFPIIDNEMYASELMQPSSFFAKTVHGKIAGITSVHDLSDLKQYKLENFSNYFRIIRPFFNAFLYLNNEFPIPGKGSAIQLAFLGFPLIQNSDPSVFRDLLTHICNELSGNKYHFVCLALHEKSPLNPCLRHFSRIKYDSRMYLVKLSHDTCATDPSSLMKTCPFIDFPRL